MLVNKFIQLLKKYYIKSVACQIYVTIAWHCAQTGMIDPVDSPVSAVCCQPGREKK
jgi:hypothetical protein